MHDLPSTEENLKPSPGFDNSASFETTAFLCAATASELVAWFIYFQYGEIEWALIVSGIVVFATYPLLLRWRKPVNEESMSDPIPNDLGFFDRLL